MIIPFDDCAVMVEGSSVTIRRGDSGVTIPLPFNKYEVSYKVERWYGKLRDLESQYLCDKVGSVRRLRRRMLINLRGNEGDYLIIIVRDFDNYHVFYGWSWFDGDEYGFIWADTL